MVDTSVLDKSMRSVFVGNIPYETTEEKLKDIFSAVGPVLSFKLVFDRENGKPKGYGFCEYKDQETALSAMRNLNGYEIAGRSLRVDNACTEKSRLEMQSLLAGPPIDNTYGEPIESEKAPEAISKAVASLPPEQMFELMKQMKLCIQNNPTEGRQMLLQNPQLAYALLQAQVVMRIVDPQIAITMLHKVNPPSNAMPTPVVPVPVPQQPPMNQTIAPPLMQSGPIPAMPPQPMMPPQPIPPQTMPPKPMDTGMVPQPRMPNHPSVIPVPGPQSLLPPQVVAGQDMDLRTLNRMVPPRGVMNQPIPPMGPSPLLGGPMGGPMVPGTGGPMGPGPGGPMGPVSTGPMPPVPPLPADQDMRIPPTPIPPPPSGDLTARDPRGIYPRDPRAVVKPAGPPVPPPQAAPPKPVFPAASAVVAAAQSPSQSTSASDQEKAALIMQVLQLSDDQIAMLPPEQRQSIIVLKEQIAKSTQQR